MGTGRWKWLKGTVIKQLDLLSGYWQVEVAEGDRDKTAFATQSGLFESKVMPFGLCNAPATFQRLMDLVLAGVQWSHCLVYMDDIIIVGRSFKDHLQNLSVVLQRLKEANLCLKPAKCSFCKTKVSYLRHNYCLKTGSGHGSRKDQQGI